jgi:hypothetical protein
MMTYEEFKNSHAVRALLASMGNIPAAPCAVSSVNNPESWLMALEISPTYAAFRHHIVRLNNPHHGYWIDAIKRRAGTASTGEFWLLMGIAMLTDFGHIANQLTKANARRRTGPWSGMYGCLDQNHAAALAACVYHSATA